MQHHDHELPMDILDGMTPKAYQERYGVNDLRAKLGLARLVDQDDIDNRTLYHKGTENTMPLHKIVRAAANELMTLMASTLPEGRAKSVAFTKIEEFEMWAIKAVCELDPIVRES